LGLRPSQFATFCADLEGGEKDNYSQRRMSEFFA
jgi:hypothetical protein